MLLPHRLGNDRTGDVESYRGYRILNAIILAAGMGERLWPLTNDRPKPLVSVLGEPMIERQIRFLHDAGVDDITVVAGYFSEKLHYLVPKYGVDIVYNDKYGTYNNIYSVYLVRHLLGDTYIVEGDVYLHKNIFLKSPRRSCYFSAMRSNFVNEWILDFDASNRVTGIRIADGTGYIMSGVSYWTSSESRKIRHFLERRIEVPGFETLFWDDIVRENISNFDVWIEKLASDDLFEIDTPSDLRRVEELVLGRNSGLHVLGDTADEGVVNESEASSRKTQEPLMPQVEGNLG